MNKKAFTMAEVLITILIIGVVGAMTIPTLIGGTSDRELVAGVRKANSTLINAMKAAEAKHGQARFWSYKDNNQANLFFNIIGANMNLNKICHNQEGCTGTGYSGASIDTYGYGSPDTSAIAADGMNWIYDLTPCSESNATNCNFQEFWVDVNGHKKGPNQLCIDLHHWKWTLDTKTITPDACTRDVLIDGEIVY